MEKEEPEPAPDRATEKGGRIMEQKKKETVICPLCLNDTEWHEPTVDYMGLEA